MQFNFLKLLSAIFGLFDFRSVQKREQEPDLATIKREESKQELELEKLRKEIAKIDDDREKLNLEKRQLTIEVRTLDCSLWRFLFNLSRILPGASGIIALIVSVWTYNTVNQRIADSQIKKAEADERLDQDKFFRETLLKATEKDVPIATHIAFLSALNAFWNARQAATLANAFTSLVLYSDEKYTIEVCGTSLSHAYEVPSEQSDRDAIREELFGSLGSGDELSGKIGLIQRMLNRLAEPSYKSDFNQELGALRSRELLNVISSNKSHLHATNFTGFQAEGLQLVGADFTGVDCS
jgi:hypothetical protein